MNAERQGVHDNVASRRHEHKTFWLHYTQEKQIFTCDRKQSKQAGRQTHTTLALPRINWGSGEVHEILCTRTKVWWEGGRGTDVVLLIACLDVVGGRIPTQWAERDGLTLPKHQNSQGGCSPQRLRKRSSFCSWISCIQSSVEYTGVVTANSHHLTVTSIILHTFPGQLPQERLNFLLFSKSLSHGWARHEGDEK
jgi:hypothetical protein